MGKSSGVPGVVPPDAIGAGCLARDGIGGRGLS